MNPYPVDCHKYVICVKNSDNSYSGVVSECSDGEDFDRAARACVPSSQVSCRNRVARDSPSTPAPTAAPSCNGQSISCADCNSLRICSYSSSGYNFMQDVQCSDGKKNTYCDSTASSCTDKIPSECSSGYQCTSKGYFPDATDCTFYHFCYEDESGRLLSQPQYCDAGQVFSTAQSMCVNRLRPSDCHVATCPLNKTLITSFPGEPSFYVICVVGKPEFVYYCGENQEFNAAKSVCEVKCNQAGRISDPQNCAGYYECTANRVGGGFTATAKACPPSTKFDRNTRTCVSGNCPD